MSDLRILSGMKRCLVPARKTDLPYIVEVYNSIVPGGEVTADLEPVSVVDWTPWFESHDPDRTPVYMLQEGDEICGWMSFSTYYDRPAWNITLEVSIYLEERARGEGRGIAFLEAGIRAVAGKGVENLLAFIYRDNERSIRLFEKAGFEHWGRLPEVCRMRGTYRDVDILGRRIRERRS